MSLLLAVTTLDPVAAPRFAQLALAWYALHSAH